MKPLERWTGAGRARLDPPAYVRGQIPAGSARKSIVKAPCRPIIGS
jgi:hypothetical protein